MWNAICLFMTSNAGNGLICGFIIFCGLWWFGRFWKQARALSLDLDKLIRRIEELSSSDAFLRGFDEFSEWVRSHGILGEAWNEFDATLLRSEDELGRPRLRNPHEASYYFNEATITGSRLNLAFWGQVPGYLTGLGIFGTFVGLVCGISLASGGLASGDEAALKTALQQLLGGASTAFATSVFGLFLGLPFSWYEKRKVHQIAASIDKFNDCLEMRLEVVTLENLADQSLRKQEEQRILLADFNNTLATKIAGAIDERLFGKLNESLDKLIAAVEGQRDDRRQTDEGVLRSLVEEVHSLIERSAGGEMKSLAAALEVLNGTLTRSSEAMEAQRTAMSDWSSRQARAIEDQARSGKALLETGIGELLEKIGAGLEKSGESSARTLREAGDATLARLEGAAGAFTGGMETLRKSLETMGAELSRHMESSGKAMRETLDQSVRESAQAAYGAAHKTAEEFTAAGTRIASELAESVQTLNEAARTSVDDAAAKLALAIQQATARLDHAGANLGSSLEAGTRKLEGGASKLEGASNHAATRLDEISKALVSMQTLAIEAQQKAMTDWASRHARAVEDQMKSGQALLESGIGGLLDKIGAGLEKSGETGAKTVRDAGAELARAIDQATGRLEGASTTLGTALDRGGQKLEDGAGRLGDASNQAAARLDSASQALLKLQTLAAELTKLQEAIRAAAAPLEVQARAMGEAGGRIAEATRLTGASVATAAEMARGLQESSSTLSKSWQKHWADYQKAEGSIQGIFENLNKGLESYSVRVREFHRELDKNVADAIGKLSNLVSELTQGSSGIDDQLDTVVDKLEKIREALDKPGPGRKA